MAKNHSSFLLICGLLGISIFYFDLITPLGVAGGVPYVILITASVWTRNKYHAVMLGVMATLLTMAGYALSTPYVDEWIVILNRFYAILAIWIFVFLLIKLFSLLDLAVFRSEIDNLTGLKNRAYLFTQGEYLMHLHKRNDSPLSLLFIDLDDFKLINDTYGHHAGDLFLKKIGETFLKQTRSTDIVARFGGDEFVILMPDTPLSDALSLAEKLCLILEDTRMDDFEQVRFKASIGVASTMAAAKQDVTKQDVNSIEDLIMQADNALYEVKHDGKSRCGCCSSVIAAV